MKSEAEIREKYKSIEAELFETKSLQRHERLAHHMQALEWVLE